MKTSRPSLLQTPQHQSFNASLTGLSHQEAEIRLQTYGPNELPGGKNRSFWTILFDVLREPMLLLLLGCGGIYLFLGEPQEALILLTFVVFVILITLHQSTKSERAIEALRDLSSPRTLVIREGISLRIPGNHVVPGDLLVLREGDRIAADATLLDSSHLIVDESLVTGESIPVRKQVASPDRQSRGTTHPGGEDHPFLYSGTLVISGHGLARVTATGIQAEIGKIGLSLNMIENTESLLQIETGKWVQRLAVMGGGLCLIVTLLLGLLHGDWLNGVLAGLTLAMAILPEEFPVIMTIFLAMGAYRLSLINVLTRRSQTIETLGSTTVLCTDKTGTLTENQMRLRALCSNGIVVKGESLKSGIPESHHLLLETAILASQPEPFDPMERELLSMGLQHAVEHIHQDWILQKEYPLTPSLLAMSCVWKSADSEQLIVAAKGSPEAIIDLCHLSPRENSRIQEDINRLAHCGLRVLGVARATSSCLPEIQHDFEFKYVGLVGFEDPLRESVPNAIGLCHSAGIQVVMITGDYSETARHIGNTIGLSKGLVITGAELKGMSNKALQEKLPKVQVFARVVPEQKLRIIQAFQASGAVVGMTGDGVNDAPALKAADIGIAMGQRGTDVAREAADLVLLDDAFESIVSGVRTGRRIFDNLQKAMAYVIAVHIPIAGMSLLPVILEGLTREAWPAVLMPIHIVFLQLIIDPACSLVFEVEPEEHHIMERPPRGPNERLLTRRLILMSLFQGLNALAVVVLAYVYGFTQGLAQEKLRAVVFSTLVLSNLFLLTTNRSWQESFFSVFRKGNKVFWSVTLGTMATLITGLMIPSVSHILHLSAISAKEFLATLLLSMSSIVWFEIYKFIIQRNLQRAKGPSRNASRSKMKHRKHNRRKPSNKSTESQ